MKATAKSNVNYNGVWYRVGDVLDVADKDKDELAEYCEFEKATEPKEEFYIEDRPRRGRRKKIEE